MQTDMDSLLAPAPPSAGMSPPALTCSGSVPAVPGHNLVLLIGAYKLIKAVLMLAVGVTALRLVHHDMVVVVAAWTHSLHLDPENRILAHDIMPRVARLNPGNLRVLGLGALAYASLYLVQGIGLLGERRWAEWLTVVSGLGLVPFEIHALIHRPTWVKAVILASNLAMAIFLFYHVRRKERIARLRCSHGTVG